MEDIIEAVESITGVSLNPDDQAKLQERLRDLGVVEPKTLVEVVDMLVEGQSEKALRKLSAEKALRKLSAAMNNE